MSSVFKYVSRLVVPLPRGVQVRTIAGKALRNPDSCVTNKPTPWPYNEKPYRIWHRLFDKTTSRFDQNTKIIVVEGPIAAGKSDFACNLAQELDMFYLPEANLDMFYINDYGTDLRSYDNLVPKSCRSFDVKDFCLDPKARLAAAFQIIQYSLKYSQYIDALAHVLSTGQGVVLDRCVYSDMVFAEAMVRCNYMSKQALNVYYDVKRSTILELMRPHLVIYLDVPVSEIRNRINKRKIWYEINSPIFKGDYLSEMENIYKQKYLPEISKHAELLVYDWSSKGDVEVVVEDIERIDFERFDNHDSKMSDWRIIDEEDWSMARALYADEKQHLMMHFNVPHFEVPELVTEAEDIKAARDIWNSAPGERFESGFNSNAGDNNVLFKLNGRKRLTLPIRERIIPPPPSQ